MCVSQADHVRRHGARRASVAAVTVPVLLVTGDRGLPTLEHMVDLSHLLPHAPLVVLPGGHGDSLGELLAAHQTWYAELTAWMIEQFLDEPAPGPAGR